MRWVLALLGLVWAGSVQAQPAFQQFIHSTNSSTSVTATISTGGTNRILVAILEWNNFNATTLSSTSGLTWTFIGSCKTGEFATGTNCSGNGSGPIGMWYAKAAAQLTSEVVTATHTGSAFNSLTVIEISGADMTTPLDTNASNPGATQDGITGATQCTTYSSAAKTLMIAALRLASPGAASGGWTTINNADFMIEGYRAFTTAQPSGVGASFGNSGANGGICTAFQAAPSTTTFFRAMGPGR